MTSASAFAIRKSAALVLCVGVVALIGLNIALLLQNRKLKQQLVAPPDLVPKIGTRIDALEGIALNGSKIRLPFTGQGKETLLFVFSTDCGVCSLNWPTWQSIAQSIPNGSYRLAYADVMSHMTETYAQEYRIAGAPVFAELDAQNQAALNLRLTPLTILLSSNGEVERVWVGLLEGKQLSDLERRLGLANL